MPVRLTDIPGLRSTQLNMPGVDPRVAAAPAMALGDVAEGIASVSTAFRKLAPELQEKEETRHELDFTRQWEGEITKAETAAAKEKDPAKKMAIMTDLHTRMRKGARSSQYSEKTRAAVGGWTEKKVETSRIQTAGQVAHTVSNGANEAVLANVDFAIETNNPVMLEDTLEKGKSARIISPEQEVQARYRYQEKQEYDEISVGIRNDPDKMAETLSNPEIRKQYPHTPLEKLDGFRRQAQYDSNVHREKLWNGLLTDATRDDGQRRVLSKDELGALVKDGKLTEEQSLGYSNNFHAPEPPVFDEAAYNNIHGRVAQYDPGDDQGGYKIAGLRQDIATASLPPDSLRKLNGMLDGRLNKDKPVAHRLQSEFSKQTQEKFYAGHFGGGWSRLARNNRSEIIDEPTYRKAQEKMRQFTDLFESYLEKQPEDIDQIEVQTAYNQFFEKFVLKDSDETLNPLIPSAPPAVSYEEQAQQIAGIPAAAPGAPPTPPKLAEVEIAGPGRFYQQVKVDSEEGLPLPTPDRRISPDTADGAALPLEMVRQTFPGKDEAWIQKNVRVVVRTKDGREAVMPVARLVPAGESAWEKNKKPSITLTHGAVKRLGGNVDKSLSSPSAPPTISGLGRGVTFALTTDNAGREFDLATHTWEETRDNWFKDKKPTSIEEITTGLAATKKHWLRAQNSQP